MPETIEGKLLHFPTPNERKAKIMPHDISSIDSFYLLFADSRTTNAARSVVRFCQDRRDWHFAERDIDQFHRAKNNDEEFPLSQLLEQGLIVRRRDGLYRASDKLIDTCFTAAPSVKDPFDSAYSNDR